MKLICYLPSFIIFGIFTLMSRYESTILLFIGVCIGIFNCFLIELTTKMLKVKK